MAWILLATAGHDDLVAWCRDHDIPWVEDPTNDSPKYTRNRLRAALHNEGLDARRIATTARRMERASDALRVLSDRLLQKALIEKNDDAWTLDLNHLRAEPFELAVRVLRTCIDSLGPESDYGARYDRVENLCTALLDASSPNAMTLGGCVVRVNPKKATLSVMAESRQNVGKSLPLQANGL